MVSISPVKPAAKIVSSVPAERAQLSEDALKYAEIFNSHALKLYPHFAGLFNTTQSVLLTLQAWKSVLRPDEIKKVKEDAHKEWGQLMAKNSNQQAAAQPEIDRLLASVVVPKDKLAASKSGSDISEEESREKPKPMSS